MTSPKLLRSVVTLAAALALAQGCTETEASTPDARDGELDATLDVAIDATLDVAIDAAIDDDSPESSPLDVNDATSTDAPRDRSRDLDIRLGAWSAERGHRAEFRLVDRDGSVDTLMVLRAVSTGMERFVLAGAMGDSPARLDWYLDLDGDGRYGASDTASHALAPTAPPYALTLAPGALPGDPAPLPAGRVDLVGRLRGFEVHAGVRFDLTVTEVGSERTVAVYRDEALSGADVFDLRLPGVLRPGVAYRVFLYLDLNDNGVYDLHGDHGSGIEGTATAGGLTLGHNHHSNTSWWE